MRKRTSPALGGATSMVSMLSGCFSAQATAALQVITEKQHQPVTLFMFFLVTFS